MSRYILTGDWHVKKGIQVDIILNFLEFLRSYYWDNQCRAIIVNGDVFDKSSSIRNEAFIPLFKKLMEMQREGVEFHFILGNHDIMNVDNDSIVETFSAFGYVYKNGQEVFIGDDIFYFLPYTKNEEDIPESGDIMIAHLSIADFEFDNAFHATEKKAFRKSLFENWNMVFTGHFHKHQAKDNICYIGSPNQLHRGEMGQDKGFVELDTSTENWEFIPYSEAPYFIEMNENDIVNLANMRFDNTFVIVRVGRKIKDYSKLRYVLFEKGAVDIIPIFEITKEEDDEEQTIEMNNDIVDITKKIVSERKPEHLSENRLLEILDEAIS